MLPTNVIVIIPVITNVYANRNFYEYDLKKQNINADLLYDINIITITLFWIFRTFLCIMRIRYIFAHLNSSQIIV